MFERIDDIHVTNRSLSAFAYDCSAGPVLVQSAIRTLVHIQNDEASNCLQTVVIIKSHIIYSCMFAYAN